LPSQRPFIMDSISKKKVLKWLFEEGFKPIATSVAGSKLDIGISVAGCEMQVTENARGDAILVRSNFVFNSYQADLFARMEHKTKMEYLWDLRLRLLGNNEVGAFQLKGSSRGIEALVQARGIFRDGLTKDRLIQSVLVVHKSITMASWLLEKYAGADEPKGTASYM